MDIKEQIHGLTEEMLLPKSGNWLPLIHSLALPQRISPLEKVLPKHWKKVLR